MAKRNWMAQLQKLDKALVERTDPYQHVFRSHSPSLNFCYGKGWGLPRAYSIIVYGPPKSGKTIYCYDTIGTMHEEDPEGIAIRFDTEHRDEAQLTVETAPLYGIDLDRYQCYQTNHPKDIYNQIANKIEPMLKDGLPLRIMALDSMNGIQGVRSASGEVDIMKQQIGDVAKTNKEGLKAVLELQRQYKFSLLMTSHVAVEMDPKEQKRGNLYKMGASVGVQHHAEYFMYFEPIKGKVGASDQFGNLLADEKKLDSQGWKDQTAHRIRCTMKGASMGGGAGRHGQFTFSYAGGIINQHEEVHVLGKNRGVIYHPAKDEKSNPNPQMWGIRNHPLVAIRGEENFVSWLKTDQEAQKFILDELRAQDRDGRASQYDAADFAANASVPDDVDEQAQAE